MIGRLSVAVCAIGILTGCSGDAVSGPVITRLVVSAPLTTIAVGASAQLTATAQTATGVVVPAGTISWVTSAPSVASVSSSGLVLALAAGQTTISATAGGATGVLLITVTPRIPASATVSMPANTFTPFNTTISVGGTVNYDFPAEPHNVIFDRLTGAPSDIQQTNNRTVSRTFPTAGNFPYNCTLHPGMRGEVAAR